MEFVHKSVLFDESIDSLNIDDSKTIVDGTAGGGGHSRAIAAKAGRLIAIDQDPDAIRVLHERLDDLGNVTIVQSNFSNVDQVLKELNVASIDGMLLDLGVSSFQLDTADRGFSYHKDAPLDMRMSKSGLSAKDVVNTYSEEELANILFKNGEEKFARRIARNIVLARQDRPIETTGELVEIIKASYPKAKMRDSHPARKTFQAIRIEVNDELGQLEKAVDEFCDVLAPEGRLCIITFHSLEDRIVKDVINKRINPCTCPKEFPVCVCGKTGDIKKRSNKPISPTAAEIERNPRARSAKLRVAEKI